MKYNYVIPPTTLHTDSERLQKKKFLCYLIVIKNVLARATLLQRCTDNLHYHNCKSIRDI